MNKKLLLLLAVIGAGQSALVHAEWSTGNFQSQQILRTYAEAEDQFGRLESQDMEVVIAFNSGNTTGNVGIIGGFSDGHVFCKDGFRQPNLGEQKVIDFGVAEINGTYVRFEGVCDVLMTKETTMFDGSKIQSKPAWHIEYQPTSKEGADFIVKQLANKKDLVIKFERMELPSTKITHTIRNENFTDLYKTVVAKSQAL